MSVDAPPERRPDVSTAPSKIHDFDSSNKENDDRKYLHIYHAAFQKHYPDYVGLVLNLRNNEGQRRGVDATVFLGRDKIIRVDFKHDHYPPNNYFLEFVSADSTGAESWLTKPVSCDIFAYGFVEHGFADIIPSAALQHAWRAYGEQWKRVYGVSKIPNNGYMTHGVPVPRTVVWDAIVSVLCCMPRLSVIK